MESKKDKLISGLYKKFYTVLYLNLFKYTKNKADVKDIIQDVYLAICKQPLSNLEKSPDKLKNYVFTLGKNRMIDLLRKNETVRKYFASQIYQSLNYDLDILSTLEYDYVIKELNARLDNTSVEILVLNAKKYSAKEIGGLLNKSESSVRTALHRVKKKAIIIVEDLYAQS